jgi:hypothetical protein
MEKVRTKGGFTMAGTITTQMVDSQLLSPLAQQCLRARITDAPGGIAAVAHEVRTQLEELDSMNMSGNAAAQHMRLADRAFYVAQLEYLDAMARVAEPVAQADRRGLLERLRGIFRHSQTAK